MRPAVVVPAFEAARTIVEVIEGLRALVPVHAPIIVVDDGSTDATAPLALASGARVVAHTRNLGKGAALLTGFREARAMGCDTVLTVDADGQHLPEDAVRVLAAGAAAGALVLGVRDLRAGGAPRANAFGNAVSNFFLSLFARRALRDSQCGLRRYPLAPILALSPRDRRFGFESEVILRAAWHGIPIVEVPVCALYGPRGSRRTHYRAFIDSFRIGARIAATVLSRFAIDPIERARTNWGDGRSAADGEPRAAAGERKGDGSHRERKDERNRRRDAEQHEHTHDAQARRHGRLEHALGGARSRDEVARDRE